MVAKQAADKGIIEFEKNAGADIDIILIAIQEHVRLCVFYRCRKCLFLKDLLVPEILTRTRVNASPAAL